MKKIIMIVLLVLESSLEYAQLVNLQHTGGPMGGIIGDIAINSKGDIYAGAYPFLFYYSGLYRSTNDGESWQKIETQFDDFEVYAIYITKEDHIWVGTNYQGRIYLSTDDGRTWENKRTGYNGVECWAFGESKDGVLFAGDAESGKAYRSLDYGENWEFSGYLDPLVFATDTNNMVFCGTQSGLYFSSDNGISWQKNYLFGDTSVSSILIDSSNDIYCGTGYYTNGNGVWYSRDGGSSWIHLGPAGKVVLSLAFDSESNLYAGTQKDGLFVTSDMGLNWIQYTNGLYKKEVFRLKINEQDDIFIGAENEGVFRSTNRGESFEQIGLPISNVGNIAFNGDNLIFAATPSGVQKYNRMTKKWMNMGLLNVEAVAITPSDYLYAATSQAPFTFLYETGLYKSTDLGNSWILTNLTIDTMMSAYNVLAVNDDTVFVATGAEGLRRSFDGGLTWDALPIRTGFFQRAMYLNGNDFWLIGVDPVLPIKNLYKSTNFGVTFDSTFSGFDSQPKNNSIFATGNYVFLVDATGLEGLFRSTDNGINWEQKLYTRGLISVFAENNGLVIAGSDSILISQDFGETWISIPQPIEGAGYISDIKKDFENNYFFGTTSKGLYKTELILDVNELNYTYSKNYNLYQNYPNPFNPTTTIQFTLPESEQIKLEIFNVLGEKVQTLLDGFYNSGIHKLEFNAVNLPSGIYFYQLQAGSFVATKKLILLK